MDIFPIWKTSYYPTTESDAVFRIMKWGTQEIYRGRGRRYPDGNYLDINLNRSTQNTLDSMIWEALGASGDTVALSNGYAEFSLDFYDSSTDIWTTVYQFAMVNDWSYEEHEGNVYSEPINGHACPGMVLPYSYLVTGETETVCYEEFDLGAHIYISPSSISFGATGGTVTITVTADANWRVTNSTCDYILSQTTGTSGSTTITVTAGENSGTSQINCSITFASTNEYGTTTVVVPITQAGATPYFTVTSGDGATFDGRTAQWTITYDTNVVPVYWVLSNGQTGYTSGGTVTVTLPKNYGQTATTYTITFYTEPGGTALSTATATQDSSGEYFVITSGDNAVFDHSGGTWEVTFNTSYDSVYYEFSGGETGYTSGNSLSVEIPYGLSEESYTIDFYTEPGGDLMATAHSTRNEVEEGEYLTLTITSDGTLRFINRNNFLNGSYEDFVWATGSGDWYWSNDSGATWNSVSLNGITTATTYEYEMNVESGQTYWICGANSVAYHFPGSHQGGYRHIGGTATFTAKGDPKAVYGPNGSAIDHAEKWCLAGLFKNSNITSASGITINADSGVSCQYYAMFSGCSILDSIPSEINSNGKCYPYCFADMFRRTRIGRIPTINITSMDGNCFSHTFEGCTSLSRITLPDITLASRCYHGMFENCTGLVAAEIQSTTLATYALYQMFKNCSSLLSVRLAWRYGTKPTGATNEWLYGVARVGILYNSAGASNWPSNSSSNYYSGIPANWQIQSY